MPRRIREIENPWIHGGLAVVVACLLLLLSFHMPFVRYMVDGAAILLRLPEYPALFLRERVTGFYRWIESGEDMQRRMDLLEKQNLLLRTTLARYTLYRNEEETTPLPSLLTASVLVRHPSSWWEEIKIDIGTLQGVRPGSPVLYGGYLVGRVHRAGRFDAWVRLITSRNFSIPVTVEDTRDLGVLGGNGEGEIFLQYIPEERSLPLRSPVVTALLDEGFPPGIPVGVLGEPRNLLGGFRSYLVHSGVPLSRFYRVSVMIGGNIP